MDLQTGFSSACYLISAAANMLIFLRGHHPVAYGSMSPSSFLVTFPLVKEKQSFLCMFHRGVTTYLFTAACFYIIGPLIFKCDTSGVTVYH